VDFSRAFLSLPFSPFRNTRLNGDTIPGWRKRERGNYTPRPEEVKNTRAYFSVTIILCVWSVACCAKIILANVLYMHFTFIY